VLIAAGWVLVSAQPHGNWFRGHALAWSGDLGLRHVVEQVGTWLGVLAFGIGYALGLTLELPRGPRSSSRRHTIAWPPTSLSPPNGVSSSSSGNATSKRRPTNAWRHRTEVLRVRSRRLPRTRASYPSPVGSVTGKAQAKRSQT
jgi:hypothetical protein